MYQALQNLLPHEDFVVTMTAKHTVNKTLLILFIQYMFIEDLLFSGTILGGRNIARLRISSLTLHLLVEKTVSNKEIYA